MFEQFNASVEIYYDGQPLEGKGAECIINSIGITINDVTIPMANIIRYQKLKLEKPIGEYEYRLIIHVVNWVK